MTDIDILNFVSKYKKINWKFIPDNYKIYLLHRFKSFSSETENLIYSESLFRIKNNINEIPICPICKSLCKFNGKKYLKTCGNLHCLAKECQNKRQETFINKYGVKSNLSFKSVKDKCKETMLAKYGVDNIWKTKEGQNKCKTTIIKNHGGLGAAAKDIKEKMENTNLVKYGWKHNWQDPNEQKRSHSIEAKEKQKQTYFDKYGVYHNMQSDICKNKRKETWINKYGVDSPTKNGNILNKIIASKKEHNTFNKSSTENKSYDLLKEKYINIIRQYKSTEYPFACDFYIPEINTYIECNYFWTHGGKPFENTEDDNIKLQKWIEKNKKFYDNAIITWTIRDVNKRKIAKENNLNFIEFFSIFELQKWLNNE